MVRTGDLLTGRVDSPVAVYMDTLYELWGSDTVHGDKIAYSKLAIGLLDSLNRTLPDSDLRHNIQSRKRSLDSSPDLLYRREDSFTRRFSDRQGGRTASPPTSPTGTIPSSPTGTFQPSTPTRAPAANLAALVGAAAAAASTTKQGRTRCGRDSKTAGLK